MDAADMHAKESGCQSAAHSEPNLSIVYVPFKATAFRVVREKIMLKIAMFLFNVTLH